MPRRRPDETARDIEPVTLELEVESVQRSQPGPEGFETVVLDTTRGPVEMRYYPVDHAHRAAIFVGGVGGGFDTPVRGWLYPRLSQRLRGEGVAALRVRYRKPGELLECVLDVLAGAQFLQSEGAERIAVCGHSFGGAVVIQAAAASDLIRTCIALSTQTMGVDPAPDLAPRCSLLLGHGTADEVLPHRCSEYVHRIAGEPKRLVLKEGARHGLDEWADELPDLLDQWIHDELNRA